MDIRELYWAAGLIEGEGSFSGKGVGDKGHAMAVGQRDKECLVRLQRLFGGAIYERTMKDRPFYEWSVTGTLARSIMMTLFPLLTKRRQQQITACLLPWVTKITHGGRYAALRTHCSRGHEYKPGSFRRYGKKQVRHCLICKQVHSQAEAVARKEARHARGLKIVPRHPQDESTLLLF